MRDQQPGDQALAAYYARRAPEYERIYQRPERRDDLLALGERIRTLVAGADVLEVACGTGYWTERFAGVTRSVLATDIGGVVLFDNRCVLGESLPISRRDGAGDTFQVRRLADGSEHEIRKNFPTARELEAAAAPFGAEIAVAEWPYFWCLSYLTAA